MPYIDLRALKDAYSRQPAPKLKALEPASWITDREAMILVEKSWAYPSLRIFVEKGSACTSPDEDEILVTAFGIPLQKTDNPYYYKLAGGFRDIQLNAGIPLFVGSERQVLVFENNIWHLEQVAPDDDNLEEVI